MIKTSLYENASYCLSFNGDTIFLDIRVEIQRITTEAGEVYKAKVLSAQLNGVEEGFPIFLVSLLPSAALEKVNERLHEMLVAELSPSLFTLFYVGKIQDANPTA